MLGTKSLEALIESLSVHDSTNLASRSIDYCSWYYMRPSFDLNWCNEAPVVYDACISEAFGSGGISICGSPIGSPACGGGKALMMRLA